jgi:hypothetical protein
MVKETNKSMQITVTVDEYARLFRVAKARGSTPSKVAGEMVKRVLETVRMAGAVESFGRGDP